MLYFRMTELKISLNLKNKMAAAVIWLVNYRQKAVQGDVLGYGIWTQI